MIGFDKALSLWILKCAVATRSGETLRSFDAIGRGLENQEHLRPHAAHSTMPPQQPLASCYLFADRCYPEVLSTRLRSAGAHRTILNWCVAQVLRRGFPLIPPGYLPGVVCFWVPPEEKLRMKSVVGVGAQWGEEGKGTVVDYVAG